MLNTEMEAATAGDAEPWFSTNKNWPPEFTAAAIGLEHTLTLAHTGVGGVAVPMGESTPVLWSILKPETVLAVKLETYRKFFEGCSAMETGRGVVGNKGTESDCKSPVLFCARAWTELSPCPT